MRITRLHALTAIVLLSALASCTTPAPPPPLPTPTLDPAGPLTAKVGSHVLFES